MKKDSEEVLQDDGGISNQKKQDQGEDKEKSDDIVLKKSSPKKKSSRANNFLLVFLVVLIVLTILASQYPDFADKFSMSTWFRSENYDDVSFWSAVFFTVVACFLGALIPIPIPYAIPVTIFSSVWIATMVESKAWALIMSLVIFGALGNTLGDFVDYIIGEGAEYVISKDDPELQSKWSDIILNKPKLIPWIIALFGLTPLPDSLLLVPLGFVKYDKKKTLLYMFVGKFFMMLLYALTGVYGIQWLLDLLEGESGENGWISGMLLLYLVWIIMFIMIKYKPKKKEKQGKDEEEKQIEDKEDKQIEGKEDKQIEDKEETDQL